MYLWGLVMSGKMDSERIKTLYSKIHSMSLRDGRSLEILFHPGQMKPEEMTREIPKESADSFYLSAGRNIEKAGARSTYLLPGHIRVNRK